MNKHWHEWNNLGKPADWFHLHRVAVAQNQDGRLEVFAVSTDGALWQIWQTTPNNGWSHWGTQGKPTVGGIELTSPAVGKSLEVGRNKDGRLLACVVASREVWFISQTSPNNGWGQWQTLGQPLKDGVVSFDVAQDREGHLLLFAISYTDHMASRRQIEPNGDWKEWNNDFPHSGTFTYKSFAIGQNENGRLELVVILDSVPALISLTSDGGSSSKGFNNAGLPVSGNIGTLSMARNQDGRLEAAIDIDRNIVNIRQRVPNQAVSPGGSGWDSHDLERPAEHIAVRLPVLAANRDGRLEVFAEGSDGSLWHRWQIAPNGDWSEWHSLGSPLGRKEGFNSLDIGQNQDGRLEAFIVQQGELWHTWQTE